MIDFKKHGDLIDEVCEKYDINTKLRKAHFMAQMDHETKGLKALIESLNYSVEGLISTFGRHRISLEQCKLFGRTVKKQADQKQIGNIIYGGSYGRINLGNTQDGDGYKYRGRAGFHCTGRAMYALYGKEIGIDFVSDPDLILEAPYYIDFCGWFWNYKSISKHADNDDIIRVTEKINGGRIGIDKRKILLDQYKKI